MASTAARTIDSLPYLVIEDSDVRSNLVFCKSMVGLSPSDDPLIQKQFTTRIYLNLLSFTRDQIWIPDYA